MGNNIAQRSKPSWNGLAQGSSVLTHANLTDVLISRILLSHIIMSVMNRCATALILIGILDKCYDI